ncbi:uncharacterized protein LOC107397784 [Tribolium castaneum]|uniref:uncharacterized protein LOC107397784 n=1 Tax=Tribolium castaneum TaxID=7070 RepID=UPI00077DDE9F|nr:PREDICTED: uncharacterized protein LOC107397784 [Tribolium castaneum]|eukprot:XP_015834713.1 PREDICTED: uncharacterized protein LOC107397784 [Tribolium castaneum]
MKVTDNSTTTEPTFENSTDTVPETTTTTITETTPDSNFGTRGFYGGSYYNPKACNPQNIHYVHGTYQPPIRDYYRVQKYFRDDGSDETFDYYLGYGMSKMTNNDFQYRDFHYYYHDINRTISDNETILSDHVNDCHPNATFLCPENTETVCLRNGTIYCMSKISVVVPCDNITCIQTTVPCVRACINVAFNFETLLLPCLANIVIEDVYEDGKGMSLSRVGGTFVLVPALTRIERTYCVVVVLDPEPKEEEL